MMEVCVRYLQGAGLHSVKSNVGQKDASIIQEAEAVAPSAIGKDQSSWPTRFTERDDAGTRPLHPRVNGEVLQLKTRWVANQNVLISPVKTERLSDFTRHKRYAVLRGPIVAPLNVDCAIIARPPTDHSWRRRRARLREHSAPGEAED